MSPLSSLLSRGKDADGESPDGAVVGDGAAHSAPTAPVAVRVNLLPPEIEEAASFRRGQVVRAGAVAAAVVAVVGASVLASQSVSDAQSDVDSELATAASLQADVAALQKVPETQAALAGAETQLSGAMGQEVKWSSYLNALGLITPGDIAFTDMTVLQTVDVAADPAAAGAEGAAAAAPVAPGSEVISAVGTPGIATVTFNGQARNNNDVASLLAALAKQKGNVDPYFSTAAVEIDTESDREVVAFTATVTVTDAAKSGRFEQKGS